MKRRIALTLAVIALLAVSGCRTTGNPAAGSTTTVAATTVVTPPLPDVIEAIYALKDPGLAVGDFEIDLADKDAVKYYSGLDDAAGVKGICASEAMISSQAYSLVLVQVEDVADLSLTAQAMLEGIDPMKWICVEADDLQVAAQGDLILLAMVSSALSDSVTSQELVDAFRDIRGGTLDVELGR